MVTGSFNFTSTNLTYTVTTPPTDGTVPVDTAGNFTYTPALVARAAAANPGAPTSATQDSFAVTASNSAGSAPETVTVPVSPISTANAPDTADTDPFAASATPSAPPSATSSVPSATPAQTSPSG